jgi:hypothetical protein
MRESVIKVSFRPDQWQPKYPFDVVMAYEDAATRQRAMRLHDHLARQLNDDFDLQCAWWNFEHIADPTLREQAVDDATAANMIVLSLHAGSELPPAAQMWMEDWSHRRDHHKCALVTLFAETGEPRTAASIFARLKQIARQAHMDFFTNVAEATGAIAGLNANQIAERPRAVTPTLKGILQQRFPVPRWGINES